MSRVKPTGGPVPIPREWLDDPNFGISPRMLRAYERSSGAIVVDYPIKAKS